MTSWSQQVSQFQFKHLTIDDGLSQNAVHAIIQDDLGFMWLGTKDGLNRFDGYQFTIYQSNPFDSSSLSNNHILSLFQDSQCTLWIGTMNGLNRYDRARDKFIPYRFDKSPCQYRTQFEIQSISEDDQGYLWIATISNGIVKIPVDAVSDEDPRIEYLLCQERPRLRNVRSIKCDGEWVWAGTDAGMLQIDPVTSDIKKHHLVYSRNPSAPSNDLDSAIIYILEDGSHHLWLSNTSGLCHFDKRDGTFISYPNKYAIYRYGWGLIHEIARDPVSGDLWLGSADELMKFDISSKTYTYIEYDPDNPTGIIGPSVKSVYVDEGNLIWFGTNGYGISIYDPVKTGFKTLVRTPPKNSRIQDFSVRTIFEDRHGNLWVSARVLYRWNPELTQIVSYEKTLYEVEAMGNTGVWSIIQDKEGWLWMGTYEGLFRHRVSDSTVVHYRYDSDDPGSIPEKVVYAVHEDRQGRIWIMTSNYISLFSPATGTFSHTAYSEFSNYKTPVIASVYEDKSGIFWITTGRGLLRFNPETRETRMLRNDPANPESLSNNSLLCITPDPARPEEILWIGTAGGGLNRFHVKNETFDHFNEDTGLPDNTVYAALPDNRGNLWLSTNKGLCRFDPVTLKTRNFDVSDGLQSNEFNSGAYFKSPGGELYFGGIKGINHFLPDHIKENIHTPQIVITELRLGNQRVRPGDSTNILNYNITSTDHIELSYLEDIVTLTFAALDFSTPQKNQYRYRLKGWDKNWIEAGNRRTATYSNVDPGYYTFQVIGSNNDGYWNEYGTTLDIRITPPWWRTPWAFLIYGLVTFVILAVLWRYEVRRIRLKEQLTLQHLRTQELHELDSLKTRFFANISHEFRTPLTLILGPVQRLREQLTSAEAQNLLGSVQHNANRLLHLINQILELSKLEARQLNLQTEPGEMVSHIRALTMACESHIRIQNKQLRFESERESFYAEYDHDKFEKVIINLISNAMKFTHAGDHITVNFTGIRHHHDEFATAIITISDTGDGIDEEHLPYVFDRFYQAREDQGNAGSGLGLAFVRELLELQKGSINVASKPGQGTTFTVSLPVLPSDENAGISDINEEIHIDRPAVMTGNRAPAHAVDGRKEQPMILLVEDNADIRAFIREELQSQYDVLEAENGAEGLDLAREYIPDLIVTDLMMPEMDGQTMCRALKTHIKTSHIPVIMLTAKATKKDKLAGLETGTDDYLVKPFDREELQVRIRNLISLRESLRQKFSSGQIPADALTMSADRKLHKKVCVLIEENLSNDNLGIADLSHELGMSERQLRRKFRAVFDQSPNQFIRSYRLQKAHDLLRTRNMTVSEICFAVGFNNLSYFSKCFKQQYGQTPSAYLKTNESPNA